MSMTIIEKILARKAGRDHVSHGDTVVVDVDMTVLIDLQFATMWMDPLRIHDPDKLAIIMDHAVPAPTIKDAEGGPLARKFAAKFGIEHFFDVGRHGICHQVIAENGLARPGEVLACTDSHTCAGGAYNTAARGLGPAEVFSIMCTGRPGFRSRRPSATSSSAQPGRASAARTSSCTSPTSMVTPPTTTWSSAGRGWPAIPMNDRRTIATQGAEISADFTTFGPDEVLTSYLDDRGITGYQAAAPDPDAVYRDVRLVDLAALEPYVARPGKVSRNALPVSQIEQQKIDQSFIGSCANGQLEDLAIAANILRGNTVATGVRLIVTPASQAVYREAMRLGYLEDIADAGAVVTNSTCGACFGYHMGVLGPGEVCLTVEYPQLHRPDGQPGRRDLHGLARHGRRLRDHRLHHRRKERDRMTLAITGKVWVFGDNLNTDAMYPAFAMKLDPPEAAKHVFYELRPGWTDEVSPGDIVLAGKNFGIGSSRPVAALFTELGVAALVAEEFNSLFFRNAVNAGLPAMTLPEATTVFSEGDTGTFDLGSGAWRNDTTGVSGEVPKLPELILEILSSGGVLPRLAAQGYLPAELGELLKSSTVAIRGAGSGA